MRAGKSRVTATLAGIGRWLPQRRHLKGDLAASFTGAIARVPDGMAAGLLAGAPPVYGLYAAAVGIRNPAWPTEEVEPQAIARCRDRIGAPPGG
jgi:hypothetical protein